MVSLRRGRRKQCRTIFSISLASIHVYVYVTERKSYMENKYPPRISLKHLGSTTSYVNRNSTFVYHQLFPGQFLQGTDRDHLGTKPVALSSSNYCREITRAIRIYTASTTRGKESGLKSSVPSRGRARPWTGGKRNLWGHSTTINASRSRK